MTRLQFFLQRSDLTHAAFAAQLNVSAVSVGRYCRPLSDPEGRQPRAKIGRRISELTHGLINAGNHAEEISEAEAEKMMAECAARDARAEQVTP